MAEPATLTPDLVAAVVEIQGELLTPRPVDELLGLFCHRAAELLAAPAAALLVPQGSELVVRVSTVPGAAGHRVPLEGSLTGLCARTRTLARTDDAFVDPRLHRPSVQRVGARSILAAPVVHPAGFAVLTAGRMEAGAFDASHERLIALLASLAGVALARAYDREQSELALKKLERANEELRDFASIASHDLQEPLRKVRFFAEQLRGRAGAALDEESGAHLERIEDAARRMQELVKGLLDVATFDRGGPLQAVDLTAVVQGVLADLELPIAELRAQIEVGPLPSVLGAETQLRQLFQNLIGNALKFHAPGEPPKIRIHAPGASVIEVRDQGIGFEQRHADRIFGLFQRLHGRKAYPGTGIGLALCRRIVERHGGTIEATSAPGKGSTFRVVFPRAPPEEGGSWET